MASQADDTARFAYCECTPFGEFEHDQGLSFEGGGGGFSIYASRVFFFDPVLEYRLCEVWAKGRMSGVAPRLMQKLMVQREWSESSRTILILSSCW